MVAVGLVTFILMFVMEQSDGYDLLFLYSIPANIAISLFPIEPILLYYGKFANLFVVTGMTTVGTLIAGYLDHRVFVPVLNHQRITGYKRSRLYRRVIDWFSRYPFAVLVAVGFTPLPIWPLKILAFSIHYPLSRYLTALALCRPPKYLLMAWLGMWLQVPNWVLVTFVAVIFGAYGIKMLQQGMGRTRTNGAGQVSGTSETS